MEILVVDIETTNLSEKLGAIVELGIALVNTETKEVKLVFDKVVKDKKFDYQRDKNAWVFENTTLTPEEVDNADSLDSYRDEVQALFDIYPMTAYNRPFDEKFLVEAGFKLKPAKCLMAAATTYSRYRDKKGNVKKPSVVEIYKQFFVKNGEDYVEKHRAGSDAIDESRILLHLTDLKSGKIVLTEEDKEIIKTDVKDKKVFSRKFKAIDVNDKFPFGKFKDMLFSDIVKKNSDYILWCIKNVKGFSITDEAKKLLENKKVKESA